MACPGFTADASLATSATASATMRRTASGPSGAVVPQRRFGGFGPTLPTCHWEKQMVVCGSALPGYPVPMCPEWVYVCKFPGSSRN
jgi:hypothetical protein